MMLQASAFRIALSGITLALSSVVAIEASGCAICIGFPEQTDADFLLEGWCAILARPDEQDQFKYAPVKILKGTYDRSDFDLLVDSSTRRLLQVHTDRYVLLVQASQHGPWQNHGTVSAAFEALAERLLIVGMGWRGADATDQRWSFFLPLFGHADERIRTLAYLEMGRAPYEVVRRLGHSVPRETYASILEDRQYIEWRGLAILLFAQSESAADRQRILDSFQAAKRFGVVTNLAAWTAAALEIDPLGTLDQIEQDYFRGAGRTPEELEAVWRALSMYGSQANMDTRDRIVARYSVLLDRFPNFAPQVAGDLYNWKRTELTETLRAILKQPHGLDFTEVQAIRRYVSESSSAETTGLAHD